MNLIIRTLLGFILHGEKCTPAMIDTLLSRLTLSKVEYQSDLDVIRFFFETYDGTKYSGYADLYHKHAEVNYGAYIQMFTISEDEHKILKF